MREDAPQREHALREVFNGLRWLVRTGAEWRMMPHRLARDYERLPETLQGLHFLAFAILLLARFVALLAQGA